MTVSATHAAEATAQRRKPVERRNRCVHCSQVAEGICKYGRDGMHEVMDLPAGISCSDCSHVDRCCSIFGQLPQDEVCQFFPVRFRLAVPA
jgi:hypothetical protein